MSRNGVAQHIDNLQQRGRYTFTKAELASALDLSDAALKLALLRLSKRGRLAHVKRGFYVIVPVEYRSWGCPPAEWFIDDLMVFMGQPDYYVGLLTAAALHGAAHQQPQVFQVIIGRPERRVEHSGIRIRFYAKTDLEDTPVVEVNTSTGTMRVSTPEATAYDLVTYASRVGGTRRVLTVLQELSEELRPDALTAVAPLQPMPSVQRVGWLLDSIGRMDLTEHLLEWVRERAPRRTPLVPSLPTAGYSCDCPWNVVVNDELEGDL